MSDASMHVCVGPDASQLIGFLCSLGLLEAGTRSLPDRVVRLGFTWQAVGFRPVVTVDPPIDRREIVDRLHGWIAARAHSPVLEALGDDLPCDARCFETVARELLAAGDAVSSALLAACGVARSGVERIGDTAFRTMNGAGHQHFLQFARVIASKTTPGQLERTLFGPWTYEDDKPSLRFDPADDRRHALRADDPSNAASRAPIRTERAANALAFEGLALLPVVPTSRGVETTLVYHEEGFFRIRWSLWERPLSRDAAASLLACPPVSPQPGVIAVFEARRLTVDKYRSFTPARRLQ